MSACTKIVKINLDILHVKKTHIYIIFDVACRSNEISVYFLGKKIL